MAKNCKHLLENAKYNKLNNIKNIISRMFSVIVVSTMLIGLLAGCGADKEEGGTPIYYVNISETGIESHNFEIVGDTTADKIGQMLKYLARTPEKLEYKAPLSMGIKINEVIIDANRVTIDFDSSYLQLSHTSEVLVRAAIVKTIVQLNSVRYVVFTIDGEPLIDVTGQTVGWMSAETFIYNDGNAINTYDEVVVKLYFANESGDKLVGAFRDKFYSTNIPLELFVVEELIDGPSGRVVGLYPTINPETNVISVSTSDGVCYVNLDNAFLNTVNNVPIEYAVYSIVNSLTELTNVNKVQILVNGEIPSMFTSSYERNIDIISDVETSTESEEEN